MTAPECAGCPFPDSVAALELVRLREGIRALCDAEEQRVRDINERLLAERGEPPYANGRRWLVGGILPVERVRALLDDNQGDSC